MSEAYIVLAHYREKNRGSLVLGYFQSYKEALECGREIPEYKNILGISVFSGGSVYLIREKPYSKLDFKYVSLNFE